MANRKGTNILITEPLPGTSGAEAATDYAADKVLVEARYGVGGIYEGQCTYEFDDANKKITITRVNEFVPS